MRAASGHQKCSKEKSGRDGKAEVTCTTMRSMAVAGGEKGIGQGSGALSCRHILIALSRQGQGLVKPASLSVDSALAKQGIPWS